MTLTSHNVQGPPGASSSSTTEDRPKLTREKALERAHGLLALAVNKGASVEEARTSALAACKLIAEYKLMAPARVKTKEELRDLTDEALQLWLDHLWQRRRKKSFVPVRQAVEMLAAITPLDAFTQERLHVLVRRRASALRGKGVLLAARGTGGFRFAPNVVRQT